MRNQLTLLEIDGKQLIEAMLEQWLDHHRADLRDESVETYRYVWHSFAAYLLASGQSPETIGSDSLAEFVSEIQPRAGAGQSVSRRYAWRVVDLINKVTSHAARLTGDLPNQAAANLLATPEFRYVNARDNEPLPQILDPSRAASLVNKISVDAGQLGLRSTWKLERDRTALSLMLGSGMTPLEVRSVQLSDISVKKQNGRCLPWKIRVRPTPKTVEHDAPIAPWARRRLAQWIELRAQLGLTHDGLLPATLNRPGWTDISCQISCTNTLVSLIGEDIRHGGLLRLRHTFVIRQLQRGTSLEKIALWLGLKSVDRLERYRRIMPHDEFVA